MIPGLGSLNWKTSILTGLFAVIVGFFALLFPSIAGPFLLLLVAFVVIVTSIGLIISGYSVSEEDSYLRWPLMIIGILLLVLGCIIIIFPQESATIVVYVIAIWAIVMGFQNMILSITYAETRRGLACIKRDNIHNISDYLSCSIRHFLLPFFSCRYSGYTWFSSEFLALLWG